MLRRGRGDLLYFLKINIFAQVLAGFFVGLLSGVLGIFYPNFPLFSFFIPVGIGSESAAVEKCLASVFHQPVTECNFEQKLHYLPNQVNAEKGDDESHAVCNPKGSFLVVGL